MSKPTHSKNSLLPHWDGDVYTKYAAKLYDMATRLTGWRQKLNQHALENLNPGKMLDVGCGTGYLMSLALQKDFDVYGIDPSEGMLKKAMDQHHIPSERLIQAPADTLPFPDENFDIVIASGSLVHVPNIDDAAKEIMRVIKKDGVIRIIDHTHPKEKNFFTPLATAFSQASGDILHDYEFYFGKSCQLLSHKTLGRGGYMQRWDFKKN